MSYVHRGNNGQFFTDLLRELSTNFAKFLIILSQLFRLPELQLHAMACQGVGLNGGEGGNMVNPMDVSNFFLSMWTKLLSLPGTKSM